MTFARWERWGVLSGVLAIACWLVAFALAGSSSSTTDSNAKITAYWASSSHQNRQLVAGLVFLAGLLFLLGFLAALRSRLIDAEGTPGRLTALAFGSGLVSGTFSLIAVSLFISPALAASDTSKFKLDPNTYRLVNDLGYGFWVSAAVVAAPLVWATSAIAFRSRLLPKWFAWLGVVAGILQLFAVFFLPAFIFWGWVLIASLLLFFRPSTAQTRMVNS